jgi:hypothetical protein
VTREELLNRPLVAVFAVARPDGGVHATPIWYDWDGRDLNLVVERDSRRHRWSVEAGRATVCIEHSDGGDLSFVTVEGPVTVVDPLTREVRFRLWQRYAGTAGAHDIVDAGGHESKVLLVLHPETWIPASP